MDTGITIDNAAYWIVVHACRAEVVQCRFHAGGPIIIRDGNASMACLLHGRREERVRFPGAAQLEVANAPANPRQRPPERVLVVAELDTILRIGGTFGERSQAPLVASVVSPAQPAHERAERLAWGPGRVTELACDPVGHRAAATHVPDLEERPHRAVVEHGVGLVGRPEGYSAIEQ